MDSTQEVSESAFHRPTTSRQENGNYTNFPIESKLYKKRWVMVFLFACQIILARFLMTSIGVINNIYAAYFDISYYVVDWFILIQITAMVLSTFPLAVLTFNSIIKSRKLFILLSSCAIISCACSLISFAFSNFYEFIFLGQFAVGFGVLSSSAIISSLATNWFPENQIGFAFSFKSIGFSTGCFLGYLIPSQLFTSKAAPENNAISRSLSNKTNITTALALQNWHDEVRNRFIILYGSLLLISIIVCFLAVVFIVEIPPYPPSVAQALKLHQPEGKIKDVIKNISNFFTECKNLISTNSLFY